MSVNFLSKLANFSTIKFLLRILFFVLILGGVLNHTRSFAAQCEVGECPSGWYVCDSAPNANPPRTGDMCCYANGCPSSECEDIKKCCWYGSAQVCRGPVAGGSCPASNTQTGDCGPTTYAECMDDGCCWVGSRCVERLSSYCPSEPGTANCGINSEDKCFDCVGEPPCASIAPTPVDLLTPPDGTHFYGTSSVVLSWSVPSSWGDKCNDAELNLYEVYVDKNDGNGFIQQGSAINGTTSYTYALDTSSERTYTWYVVADNGGARSTSNTFSFINSPGQNLIVTVEETPPQISACLGPSSRVLSGVGITVSVAGVTQTYTGVTGQNGVAEITVAYSTTVPSQITLCANYSENMCRAFGIKCANSALQGALQSCVTIPQNIANSTQSVTLQLSQVNKDPWVTAIDGDVLARKFINLGPCVESSVEGDFFGALLNLNKLSTGSNLYALSLLDTAFQSDISEGDGGGYANNTQLESPATTVEEINFETPQNLQNISKLEGFINPGVYKITLDNFNNSSWQYYFVGSTSSTEAPGCRAYSTIRPPGYPAFICTPSDKCYDPAPGYNHCKGGCVVPEACGTNYNYPYNVYTAGVGSMLPHVAIVYIDAGPNDTITIDRPIKAVSIPGVSTVSGTLVLVTKATVEISPTLSTPLSTYTVDSPSQIEATIISKTGIVVESANSATTPDDPLVIDGSIASTKEGSAKGKGLSVLRNLGVYNSTYPAVAVRYPLDMLARVNDFIEKAALYGIDTGLGVFDVQYEFDVVGE